MEPRTELTDNLLLLHAYSQYNDLQWTCVHDVHTSFLSPVLN